MNFEESRWLMAREVVSPAVPVVTPAIMPRAAKKGIIWLAHLPCPAAMNLAMGTGKGSLPGEHCECKGIYI